MAVTTKSWAPLLLVGAGAAIIAWLIWPFFAGLVLAAVIGTLVVPWHKRVVEARIRRPSLAAAATTALITLLILLPLSGLVFLVGTEAVSALNSLTDGQGLNTATNGLQDTLTRLALRLGVDPQTAITVVTGQARRVAEIVMARSLSFLSGIPGVLLQFGVALFALFYLLRDVDQFMVKLRGMIPLDEERTDEVLQRAKDITEATVYGTVAVAIVQGSLGGIAFRVLGLPAATLWGTIMGMLAFIPMIGPALVWIPTSAYLVISGSVVRGLGLAAFGALVIGTVDNLLRAVLVSGRAEVHSLVVFLSVLGGVVAFGASGVVVGPVVFVLALIMIDMGRLSMEQASGQAAPGAPVKPPS